MNLQHERISDAMERLKLTALATEWSGVADQFNGDDDASHADFIEALLDRLLHHSVIVPIAGESYRPRGKRKAGLLPEIE